LDPTVTYEKYASLHPSFGRIVCLAAGCLASEQRGNELIITKSFTGEEPDILDQFNRQAAYGTAVWGDMELRNDRRTEGWGRTRKWKNGEKEWELRNDGTTDRQKPPLRGKDGGGRTDGAAE